MPTKNEAMQRPANLGEVIQPATPFAQNVPPIIPREQPGLGPASLGPAPAIWTTDYDKVRQWHRPGTSQGRFPALPTKSNPQINSSSSSVATKKIAPVAAQTATNTTGIAANSAAIVTLQQTNFQGVWSSGSVYQINASVDYLGTLYYSLIANNLNHIPASSPADWKSLGSDAGFRGTWSAAATYKTSEQVTATDGNYYIALSGNTNVNPVGNPATWQLVGPANLGSLVDGPSRFAATGSTLTYRPLSNPLTATDAGASVTINIASFTLRTPKGDIGINSGSITGLFHGPLYYIYYDDPTVAGGAVTFNATGSKEAAISGAGRFFVGSIVAPASGGPDNVGNSDGGVGAQGGSTQVFLFGLVTPTLSGVDAAIVSPGNMIDGNLTTFGSVKVNTAGSANATATATLSASSPTSAPWQSLTLFVRSAVPTNAVSPGAAPASVSYSVDGGSTFTTIYSVGAATTRALQTDSVVLPVSLNLANLRIQVTAFRGSGFGQAVQLNLYEAWVVGLQ